MRLLTILRYFGGLFWLSCFASSVHSQAAPDAAPARDNAKVETTPANLARVELRLGTGPAIAVSATHDDNGAALKVGTLRVPLPVQEAREVHAETISLKGGKVVGLLRVETERGPTAVLLAPRAGGALEALWTGLLQLAGDPGERRADALEIGDRDK